MGEEELKREIEAIERLAADKADRELASTLKAIDLDAEEIRGLYNVMFANTRFADPEYETNDVIDVLVLVAALVGSVIALVVCVPTST